LKLYFLCYVILSLLTKQWYEREKVKAIPQFDMESKLKITKAVNPVANCPPIKINIQAHH
jgi:hypothetical protein